MDFSFPVWIQSLLVDNKIIVNQFTDQKGLQIESFI